MHLPRQYARIMLDNIVAQPTEHRSQDYVHPNRPPSSCIIKNLTADITNTKSVSSKNSVLSKLLEIQNGSFFLLIQNNSTTNITKFSTKSKCEWRQLGNGRHKGVVKPSYSI